MEGKEEGEEEEDEEHVQGVLVNCLSLPPCFFCPPLFILSLLPSCSPPPSLSLSLSHVYSSCTVNNEKVHLSPRQSQVGQTIFCLVYRPPVLRSLFTLPLPLSPLLRNWVAISSLCDAMLSIEINGHPTQTIKIARERNKKTRTLKKGRIKGDRHAMSTNLATSLN